ncbi:VOC family protein [Nitratireductor luteus]|uniref:VOC family protein n=1 Tax=Nitratireductor luteus TaxID=2976980 RepID=UPI00223EE229|nr:VOC family protein [Nitratireductor luteus]
MPPLPIDHCVLPVARLDEARRRMTALGFSMAADAAHPFGTGNACVFFSDGTYLEPLARIDDELASEAMTGGNIFVERDNAFRAQYGQEGFSAIVLGTDDASRDHQRFVEQGISAGAMLEFSRPFADAGGKAAQASFRLAFAAPPGWLGSFCFTCQRVNPIPFDRPDLTRHPNGVAAIEKVLVAADDAVSAGRFFAGFAGSQLSERTDGLLDVSLANGSIYIGAPAVIREIYGIRVEPSPGPKPVGIVFRCSDLALPKAVLEREDLPFEETHSRICIAPGPGQGAYLLFEERS